MTDKTIKPVKAWAVVSDLGLHPEYMFPTMEEAEDEARVFNNYGYPHHAVIPVTITQGHGDD